MTIKSDIALLVLGIMAFGYAIWKYLFNNQKKINIRSILLLEKRMGKSG